MTKYDLFLGKYRLGHFGFFFFFFDVFWDTWVLSWSYWRVTDGLERIDGGRAGVKIGIKIQKFHWQGEPDVSSIRTDIY